MTEEDKNIVEAIISRDETALVKLCNEYKTLLYHFVNRQLNEPSLSEEVVQDTFLDFIESLRDFQYQCSLKTFLFTIAKNKVIDIIRRKKIKRILFSSMPAHVIEGLTAVMFDDQLERKELSAKIKSVLDTLPNDYQLVLRLKYIEGEQVKTIAQKLSLGFKATESLIFRARKAFVKLFSASP